MDNPIIYLASFFILPLIIFFIVLGRKKDTSNFLNKQEHIKSREKWPYKKNQYLLSLNEKKFYNILKNSVDDKLIIFPKVRLADVVSIPKSLSYKNGLWWKIQAKHVDFLLCDSYYLSPVMVIELDDSTHNSYDSDKNDNFKNEVFEDIGLPLLRIKSSNYYEMNDLKQKINENLNNTNEK